MMKTLNDYMSMSYRMEIVEDKDEGGECGSKCTGCKKSMD